MTQTSEFVFVTLFDLVMARFELVHVCFDSVEFVDLTCD